METTQQSKQAADLAKLIEQLPESAYSEIESAIRKHLPKGGRWKPLMGQKYWLLNSLGSAYRREWYNDTDDSAFYERGNVFPTEAEAIASDNLTLARIKVRDWKAANGEEFVADWKNGYESKYYVVFEHNESRFVTADAFSAQWSFLPHFATADACEKFIRDCGPELLLLRDEMN